MSNILKDHKIYPWVASNRRGKKEEYNAPMGQDMPSMWRGRVK
jgi:hypothetical protein